MPKRGENIYKRKDGRWEGRIKGAEYLTGKQKYRSVYGKTYGEVKRKLEKAKQEVCSADSRCSMKMKEAVEIWYADKKEYWKESTYASYRQVIDRYVLPCLGDKPLYEITGQTMTDFISDIQTKSQSNCLSGKYLFHICNIILRIMSHIRKKTGTFLEIPDNPVVLAPKSRIILPGDSELARLEAYLLQNAADDVCLGILTVLYSGLRIGELCALTWEDIDLKNGIIHIRKNIQRVRNYDGQKNKTELLLSSPKTACSIRDIPISPALARILRTRAKSPSTPLVGGIRKERMDPRTLQYRFQKILEDCGIRHFKFHMLRHAFATRCIEKGFDSKSLSEILGHSNIQITLNLYVHSTMRQKKHLMEMIGTYAD